MPISIVIGGQFGSEGKGKVAAYFSNKLNAVATIRVGGPNSGHTVYNAEGQRFILKQLPTASVFNNNLSVIAAGSYINLEILLKEIEETKINKNNLLIDPNAVIISNESILNESKYLKENIGSTGSGTGSAVKKRIERKKNFLFAKDISELENFIQPTVPILRDFLNKKERILIEGTQGYGLSLIHSKYYPYATSRDTTAAGFLSEVGLSPLDVDDVILTIRAFPIRVAGKSGPLENEINWDYISKTSGSQENIIEYTSVSNKIRRVGLFEPTIVKEAIKANNPTKIVMNHLDYIDKNVEKRNNITEKIIQFINNIENTLGKDIDFMGFSPKNILKNNNLKFQYV